MSRGIGRTQRVALLALWQTRAELEEERAAGIPLTELKRRISSDRSNARRAIRNLMERGMVEEISEEGERRVKLTRSGHGALAFTSVFVDLTPDTIPSKPFDFDSIYRDTEWNPHGASKPPWSTAANLDLPVNDNGIPHVRADTPCPTADDLESPVSDNGNPHAKRDIPCKDEAIPESPVNDNAISRVLTWLEERL